MRAKLRSRARQELEQDLSALEETNPGAGISPKRADDLSGAARRPRELCAPRSSGRELTSLTQELRGALTEWERLVNIAKTSEPPKL